MSDEYNDFFDENGAEIVDDYDANNLEDEDHIILEDPSEQDSEGSELEEDEEEDEEENPDIIPEIQKTEKLENKIITGDKRKTSIFMTKFEYARLIGERASQIENGEHVHKSIIDKNPGIDNALDLAELELNDKTVPFPIQIERPITTTHGIQLFEKWDVRELVLPREQINYNL